MTWENRNQLIFGTTHHTENAVKRARMEARIRDLYTTLSTLEDKWKLPHIYKPVDELLKSHPDYLTLWTTQAEQTLRAHRKSLTRGRHHNPITRYFHPRLA